jgi:DNA gyrase subunit A
MIRVDMSTIRKAGRNTSGVTIVNVDKGDKVVSIAKCPKENEEEIELLDEDGNPVLETTTETPSLLDSVEENNEEQS